MTPDDLAFLARGEGAALLDELGSAPQSDPLALATMLRRRLDAGRARMVQEQYALRLRARSKFGELAGRMLFTRRLLEQSSGLSVASYKAGRLARTRPAGESVADLCCGLGGDALALAAAGFRPILVDRDPLALGLAWHNLGQAGHAVRGVLAELPALPLRASLYHLDPDRRPRGRAPASDEERWDWRDISPSPEGIASIVAECPDGAIKLGPAAPPDALDIAGEREWIGVGDSLRELVLWTGATGEPGLWRATEIVRDAAGNAVSETFAAAAAEAEDAFSTEPVEPGAFLFEPVKALVRSHLFAAFGERHGLGRIDASLAWLTGDSDPGSRLLKAYRVLAHAPLGRGTEKRLLTEAGVSCGAVKKRGVAVVPEAAMRELRGLEGPPAVLAYARSMGSKHVFVLEPLRGVEAATETSETEGG